MRWLIALALLALLCLALGLGVLLRGTNLSLAMPLIEREAEKALGRDVTFREAPWLQLGSTSVLAVSGLEIANADWGTRDALLELSEAEIQVELTSLFNPPLSIVSLRIDGLRVHLERDGQGRSNVPQLASAQPEEEIAEEPRDDEELEPPVLLRDLQLQGVEVRSFDARSEAERSFTIDRLSQKSENSEELVLSGAGSLQTRPWTLAGTHSGIASIAQGRQLWGKLEGRLDGLELIADYHLAHIAELEDLSLKARVAGPVPPRVAELSPVLDAEQPIELNISVLDVDPGVSLSAVLDLGDTEVHVSGIADDPGGGDGLDLNISLDAPSFPRLAEALGLGAIGESELDLNAVVRREGRRFVVEDLLATVGDHRVEGRLILPLLPGTTKARIDLRASGPEFAFYQRLFRRPFEVAAPYALHVQVTEGENDKENISTRVNLGKTLVAVEGQLGSFPSYRNSRMTVDIQGDDLAQ
ncbi:MAG: AsmA family protein, partial [Pseudomonadota bacterium]